jgi:hypothetical protein
MSCRDSPGRKAASRSCECEFKTSKATDPSDGCAGHVWEAVRQCVESITVRPSRSVDAAKKQIQRRFARNPVRQTDERDQTLDELFRGGGAVVDAVVSIAAT